MSQYKLKHTVVELASYTTFEFFKTAKDNLL